MNLLMNRKHFLAGMEKTIVLLIQNGADVNAQNQNKSTPLVLAAEKGKSQIK